MPQPSLPRFRVAPRERKPRIDFAGNPRYRDYLWAVYAYNGNVTARELQHLVPEHEPTERQQAAIARAHLARGYERTPEGEAGQIRRVVQNHLSKLHHNEYLRRYGSRNAVYYTLGRRAIEPLVLYYDADPKRIALLRTRSVEPGKDHFEHSRMITRIHFMTEMALRNTDTSLGTWLHDGQVASEVTFFDADQKKQRVPVIPDAYFSLERQGKREEEQPAYFCLEADRLGTVYQRFSQKMVGYYRFWKRNGKNPSRAEKELGTTHFRVLVACASHARLQGLYEHTRQTLARDPVYRQGYERVSKKGFDRVRSGISFVHENEWQTETGYAMPDMHKRFIPFV